MAINYPDALFEYAGKAQTSDVLGNLLRGYQAGRAPYQMHQQEQHQDLANKLAKMQAEMYPELTRAQIDLSKAHEGYYGAQTEQTRQQAEALKRDAALMQLIQNAMQGGTPPPQGATTGQPRGQQMPPTMMSPEGFPMSPMPGIGGGSISPTQAAIGEVVQAGQAPGQMPQQGQPGQMPQQNQPQAQIPTGEVRAQLPGMPANIQAMGPGAVLQEGDPNKAHLDELFKSNSLVAAKLASLMPNEKLGTTISHNDRTGETRIQTRLPSGRIEERIVQTGRTPEEVAGATEKAKQGIQTTAKLYEKNQEALEKDAFLDTVYNEVGNLIETRPEEMNKIIGNIYGKIPDWALSKELRDLSGQVKSYIGQISLDTGKDIKGAWNERDEKLVNSVKPVKGDTWDTFKGKWKANQLIRQHMKQRRELYAEYLDQQIPPHRAAKLAEQQTSLDSIRNEINDMVSPTVRLYRNGQPYDIPKKEAEAARAAGFMEES